MTTPREYRIGDGLTVGGTQFRVIGVSSRYVCGRDDATGEVTYFSQLDVIPDGSVVDVDSTFNPFDPQTALLTVPEDDRAMVQMWVEHLIEIDTGARPGQTDPDPHYGAGVSRARRIGYKAEQLSAVQWPDGHRHSVSRRTVERKLKILHDCGPAGLAPRSGQLRKSGGNQDREFLRILDAVLADYTTASDVTRRTLCNRIRLAFMDEHAELDFENPCADNYFRMPSESTIRRLITRRGRHLYVDKSAVNRRSFARVPHTAYHPTHPARPGGEGIADTTPMDLWCLDERGRAIRPRLTLAIDKFTRDFPSWVITVGEPNGTDLAIALAEGAVPLPLREGTPERFQLVNSRLPVKEMIALDERYEAALARPCIPFERLVLDNGSAFHSDQLNEVATALGTTLVWCNAWSPWEKGVIERSFRTVNTMFVSYFGTYLGVDPQHRGAVTEKQVTIGIETVRELFEQWVLTVYRLRPHSALCDPERPAVKLSPNQMWEASMAYAPRYPVPVTAAMLYRAYPVKWQKICWYGVQIDHFRYDAADGELDELRLRPSGVAAHKDRWEIRYNPHNRSCVWIHDPATDTFITAYLTRAPEILDPCSDELWPHVDADTQTQHKREVERAADDVRRTSAAESKRRSRRAAVARDRAHRISTTHVPLPRDDGDTTPEDRDDADAAATAQTEGADSGEPDVLADPARVQNFTPWHG